MKRKNGETAMETMYFVSAETAVNEICRTAVAEGASDVHIEPGRERVRVRFRRDGALEERYALPLPMAEKLAVRCKVMGRMNVAETRIPQDGSAVFRCGEEEYDLRLSVLPSLYGETIVIRLLSGMVPFIERNELGMLPVQEALFQRSLSGRSGMILTTGPTGSGKTSTLYAAMKLLNTPEVNIISIEDPVEYRLAGVTQVAVNEKPVAGAAGSGHHHGRRDPRQGNGGDRRPRGADRASGAVVAPYGKCRAGAVPSDGHGNPRVPGGGVSFARHFPAPRAPSVPVVPGEKGRSFYSAGMRGLRRDGKNRAYRRF